MERLEGHLLAVRFADNRAPGTQWNIEPEFALWNCFSATVEGYSRNLIQPALMTSFIPTGATRVVLEIIIPCETGFTADDWKRDATVPD